MPQDGYVQSPIQLAKWRVVESDHQSKDRSDGPECKNGDSLDYCVATELATETAPEQESHEEQPNTSKDDIRAI